jgi:hypothetical protein
MLILGQVIQTIFGIAVVGLIGGFIGWHLKKGDLVD